MDAFDLAGSPQPMNSMSPGGSQPPGDAFDMARSPTPPADAFDAAQTPDWGTLAHAHIAQHEATQGPMSDSEKVAVMQAYRQQYGGQAIAAPNETLPQMAAKTAVDNTFMQNYGAAGAGALVHAGAGAVGLFNPAGGQAIRENALGAYGMAQPGSAGGEAGGAVGGGLASLPTMFGGPAGLLLSAGEAAGNKRIDIADQRAAGENIGGGREALSALGAGAVDYGTNVLAQKLLGHVGGRLVKGFGGEIAGALEAGDAGGAAQAIVKMLTAEFGKEVVGNQAIAQVQNLANNAVAKITQPGTPLTAGAKQAAVSALVQSVLLSPLSPLMHAAGAHGGEANNPSPEAPPDYSALDIRQGVGPDPAPGTVGKRMYDLSSDDADKMFKLAEGENAGILPPSPEAHPPVLNSPAHVGEYYGKTYNDPQGAATIEAMASVNPGRFVRARVPMDQIEPGVLGEADKSQEKIDQIAAMTPEQRQALNPGILIRQHDGKFMPADGTHRFMGAAQAGDNAYRAYVPESAIGKNGVEADTANQPAGSPPVEAPAMAAASPDTGIGRTSPAPESQPQPNAGEKPSQAVQAAKAHFPDLQPVEPQTREQKEAASVAQQLGANAVFYTGGHQGRGFVLGEHPDTVFISAPSNRGVDAIRQAVGHELTRSLARTNPEAFKEILASIPDADLSAAEKEYRAKLEAGGGQENGNAIESAAALTLGKAATKERVWRAMSGKNPTAFEAFADRLSEVFGRLTEKGRTLNKIVEAWNKARPELQEKANEKPTGGENAVSDRGPVGGADERDGAGVGDSGRTASEAGQGESGTREAAEAPAVAAANEAAGKAEVKAAEVGDTVTVNHPDGTGEKVTGTVYHVGDDGHVAIETPEGRVVGGVNAEDVEPAAPPKTAKEAKARRKAKAQATAPTAPAATEKSGLPALSSLKLEPKGLEPNMDHASAVKAYNKVSEKYRTATRDMTELESRLRGDADAKKAIGEAAAGKRGNAKRTASDAAFANWLSSNAEYRAAQKKYFDLQVEKAKANDAVTAAEKAGKDRAATRDTAASEALKEKLRAYPWWELDKFIKDNGPNPNIVTRNPAQGTAEVEAAREVLSEKIDKMHDDARPPEGAEKLAKPSKPGPPATVRLPAGQKMETPPYVITELAKRGKMPATHTAEVATEPQMMKARGYMVDKWEPNVARNALNRAQAEGAQNFKQFLRTVPEFAHDPKFTVTADHQLNWNDANGGSFTFHPEHLGVLPAGDVFTPGATIGVDPDAVKSMKKGDTLVVNDSGKSPAPDVALLPSATAIARGMVKAGPNFFNQDVVPTAKNGVQAVKDAIASIDRYVNGSALDPTADTTKEHLREAWAQNDIDRVRTEAAFEPAAKMIDKYSKAAKVQMVEALEAGQPAPDPKLQPFFDAIRKVNAYLAGAASQVGIDIRKWTPDYIGRIFEFPDDKSGGGWTTSIAGAEHYLKGRVFDTFGDALKFVESVGGRLKYENPIEMQLAKWEEVRKGISMRREFTEGIQRGDIALFGPRERLPQGWKYLDDKLATLHTTPEMRTVPQTIAEGPRPDSGKAPTISGKLVKTEHVMGRYAAPEAIANVLNDNLAPGLYEKLPLWKRWAQLNHKIVSVNLGLSGAHAMNMATGGSGISFAQAADNLLKGEFNLAAKNVARGITAPVYHAINGGRIRQAMRFAGSVPGMEKYIDAGVAGGTRAGFDSILDRTSMDKATEAFAAGNPIAGTAHAVNAAWKLLSYPLFKVYIPNVKASLTMTAAETALERAGSRDELRETMGRHVNAIDNVLGEVIEANKFQHRVVRDGMQGIFLAPNWNEGLARLMGGSARDYVRAARDMTNGKSPTVTPNMLIPFGAVMSHMMFSAAINRALSGQWPQTFRDYFQPRNGQKDNDGNDMRVNLLTPFKDVPNWFKEPGRTLWNKLSPLIHMAHDIAQNSDYHGVEIWHPGDSLTDKAGEIAKYAGKAAMPFSVQSYERMKDVGADTTRKALGFAGLNPVPTYYQNTDAEKLAQELHVSQEPPGTRTQEQYDKAELRKRLAQAIRSNQPGAGQAARDALKAHKITGDDYVDMMTTKNQSYLQRTVKKLGVEDAMRVWNVASDDEKRSMVNELIAKVGDSKEWDNKPDDMKKYLLLLRDERIRLKKK